MKYEEGDADRGISPSSSSGDVAWRGGIGIGSGEGVRDLRLAVANTRLTSS